MEKLLDLVWFTELGEVKELLKYRARGVVLERILRGKCLDSRVSLRWLEKRTENSGDCP